MICFKVSYGVINKERNGRKPLHPLMSVGYTVIFLNSKIQQKLNPNIEVLKWLNPCCCLQDKLPSFVIR